MDLDEVADELYGVAPEEFVAVRKARQDEARAAGDRALAKEIGTLPKPSTAAWVCNLLVRHEPDEISSLVELGGLLREAQQALAGDELRVLDAQRRQLVAALTRQARSLAAGLGHPVSGPVALQVEESLRAAMADADAGEALLSGRLTAPLAPGGLGGFDVGAAVARPDLRVVRAPAGSRPAGRTAAGTTRGRDSGDERARREEARAIEEQWRREVEEARRAAEEARATAEETHAAADDARRAADDVRRAADRLAARVAELTAELARTEEQASEAAARLRQAERRTRTTERAAAEAAVVRDRALTRLAELQDRPAEG